LTSEWKEKELIWNTKEEVYLDEKKLFGKAAQIAQNKLYLNTEETDKERVAWAKEMSAFDAGSKQYTQDRAQWDIERGDLKDKAASALAAMEHMHKATKQKEVVWDTEKAAMEHRRGALQQEILDLEGHAAKYQLGYTEELAKREELEGLLHEADKVMRDMCGGFERAKNALTANLLLHQEVRHTQKTWERCCKDNLQLTGVGLRLVARECTSHAVDALEAAERALSKHKKEMIVVKGGHEELERITAERQKLFNEHTEMDKMRGEWMYEEDKHRINLLEYEVRLQAAEDERAHILTEVAMERVAAEQGWQKSEEAAKALIRKAKLEAGSTIRRATETATALRGPGAAAPFDSDSEPPETPTTSYMYGQRYLKSEAEAAELRSQDEKKRMAIARFEAMDANNDGVVGRDEYIAARRKEQAASANKVFRRDGERVQGTTTVISESRLQAAMDIMSPTSKRSGESPPEKRSWSLESQSQNHLKPTMGRLLSSAKASEFEQMKAKMKVARGTG